MQLLDGLIADLRIQTDKEFVGYTFGTNSLDFIALDDLQQDDVAIKWEALQEQDFGE